ncbi:Aste57867_24804 [Aphanomyces stellatus]|uniref:Aste57867_24804 protein n=1 Tax=Aphanomyces stellatus TaxID=120398 RepID=A0A485LS22_9STRA|nr:hypothetical protein As57867_024726 [Aphanomyces stellatus]VFU01439.1 Aste57867_24804 [Aphanomyces stellatus]
MKTIMVAGGAGFMGSNFVLYMLQHHTDYKIVVFDKLTYAGNLNNLIDICMDPRYRFVHGDICDAAAVNAAIETHGIDTIVNFAAETHVDRSILNPDAFVRTNVVGTYTLLECSRQHCVRRFHHVSTDEVYGEAAGDRAFLETDKLSPRSPYAASKASADLLVLSYFTSFALDVTISRASNNIGPFQYPEKVVPLFATNAMENLPLPIYGDGLQRREYQYVTDHCEALDVVLHAGVSGEIYNIGTGAPPMANIDMAELVLETLGKPRGLMRFVADRPGHDQCYHMNVEKMQALGWRARHSSREAIGKTVQWYAAHETWWRKVKSGDFRQYYAAQYGARLAADRPVN